jgi:4-hydroxy-tetrahydrodipicolinate synthase
MALRLKKECKNVSYIKVETLPITTKVADMAGAAGDQLTIFGGAGGSYFIEEMRRGARGTMPFCSQPKAFVETWDRFQAGDETGARKVFDSSIMAVNRLGAQGGDLFYHLHKQLLVRLGVIRTAVVRSPTITIDPITQREMTELIEQIAAA